MSWVHQLTARLFTLWNAQLKMGRGVQIDPRAFIARGGRVLLGDRVVIRAGALLLPSSGSITIGHTSSINQYTVITGYGGVEVGNCVMMTAFVSLFASNHSFAAP